MSPPSELGSEVFTRWAKAIWPYAVGILGMIIIIIDTLIVPPPDTATSGIGLGLITGMGAAGLSRFQKGTDDKPQ